MYYKYTYENAKDFMNIEYLVFSAGDNSDVSHSKARLKFSPQDGSNSVPGTFYRGFTPAR